MGSTFRSEHASRYPVPDRALHNVVYQAIVDAVHRGEMKPGDRITEWDIAQRLGISRSPVREAFTRLAADHLIVRLPRRGNFIAELEETDVEQIRDARQLIEGYAARSAVCHITQVDVDSLEDIVGEMIAAARAGDWMQTVSLNARFHEAVIDISGNSIIGRMWSSVDPLTWLIAATVAPGHRHDPDDLERRHRNLIEALQSGDSDVAEQAFRIHVGESVTSRQEVSSNSSEASVTISGSHLTEE